MFGKNSIIYKNWQKEWEKFQSVPHSLDIVNLGSTMSATDFDYTLWKESGVKGFNLASSPQTLYYDLQVLEQYGDHLKSGATVIICLAEYSLLVERYESDDHNYKYYGYLEPDRILNYTEQKANLVRNNPGKLDRKIKKQETVLFVKNLLGMGGGSGKVDIDIHARQVMTGWENEFGWKDGFALTEEQQETISHTWAILQKIIVYCKEHKLKPVVVVPPFAAYLKKLMPEDILKVCLWQYLDKIKADGIQVIDFWDDENLQRHELYETSLCLNAEGRKLFNDRMQHEIYSTELKYAKHPVEEGETFSAANAHAKIDSRTKELRQKGKPEKTEELGKTSMTYVLRNGVEIPWISYGTGVIWKYTRKPGLFLKTNIRELAISTYHRKWHRELDGNIHIKRVLADAYDSGFRMFDTGRIYAKSESSIGATVSNREGVFITSKCSAMDVERAGSPDSVEGNLKFTLKNLKKDTLDLYLLHWPEGDHWLEYYEQIIRAYEKGYVRAFGACNLKMEHIQAIQDAGLELPMVIQEECHPFYSRADVRAFCKDHSIQFEAHTPTMHMNPIAKDNELLNALAKKYKKSVAQIMIRWHYQNDVIPVCSTFSKKHMKENLEIFDFELMDEEMIAIDGLNMDHIVLNATGIDDPKYIYNY